MRLPSFAAAGVALAALLSGCPQGTKSDSESEIAAGDQPGTVPIPDAGTSLTVSMVLLDGGIAPVAYEPNAPTFIEPSTGFEVRARAGLRNYRLRLFDEIDRAMVSDDEAQEDSNGGTHYRAVLPEPLKAGHQYTLVLDAQSGENATNGAGRAIPEQRIALKVLGEKEKPAPPPAPAHKRRRR